MTDFLSIAERKLRGEPQAWQTDPLIWNVDATVSGCTSKIASCAPLRGNPNLLLFKIGPIPDDVYMCSVPWKQDPDGNPVTDDSDDVTDLDMDGNPDNESGGEDDPTFAYLPAIEITKTLTNQTLLADGNIELEFEMLVHNIGNANLSSVLVEDPLLFSSALVGSPTVSLMNITASTPPVDNYAAYNGSGDANLVKSAAKLFSTLP